MRLAAALAVAVLLAGCTRFQPADEPSGGAEGQVLIGPACPVERDPPEPGCEDQPYATALEAVRGGDGARFRFSSGADGRFRVPLPAGDYAVRDAEGSQQPPTCSSPPFTVTAGAYTHVEVACDSGIR